MYKCHFFLVHQRSNGVKRISELIVYFVIDMILHVLSPFVTYDKYVLIRYMTPLKAYDLM